jgi:hypothetical protein
MWYIKFPAVISIHTKCDFYLNMVKLNNMLISYPCLIFNYYYSHLFVVQISPN